MIKQRSFDEFLKCPTPSETIRKKEKRDSNKEYYLKNIDRIRDRNKEYYLKNKDRIRDHDKEYRLKNKDRMRDYFKEHYLKNIDHIRDRKKEYNLKYGKISRRKIRLEILTHYSTNPPQCACCGEKHIEFLALDHINGSGNKERRKYKIKGGASFYKFLKRQNYPPGYRILCHNCNLSYGLYKYCPHQKSEVKR